MLNLGTSTSSGLLAFATPNSSSLALSIATTAIEPNTCDILAAILTAGDCWSVAVFVRLKDTTKTAPDNVPPDAAVSTSDPLLCVHVPAVPSKPPDDSTRKFTLSAVCDPVSPEIVTVDPLGKL